MRHRERVLSDVASILAAAGCGRVHQLCARFGADENFESADASSDDPVNVAIAETLRHEGEVFMLAPSAMPDGPLAVILRY